MAHCPTIVSALILSVAATALCAPTVAAQEPPPPIGPFVIDVRGTFPKFTNELQLAQSRGLGQSELPGVGIGIDVGAQLYVFKWRAMIVGIGGQLTAARSHSSAATVSGVTVSRAVTERLTSLGTQLSFNFGTGDGWSYLSGGIGTSKWSIVPDAGEPLSVDDDRIRTLSYGGGARWFIKPHLAFHFDVRFHAMDPGRPEFGLPGSPRTTLLILGAGISIK